MGSGIHKTTIKNIEQILDLLKRNEQIHIRGIYNALGINPFLVSHIIDNYLDFFVDIKIINQFGFNAKLISLKEDKKNTTLEDVLKYIKLKGKIRSNL